MEKRVYRIKQKILSLWGKYTIRNEAEEELFKVTGKKSSFFLNRYSFQTMAGEEVLQIKQQFNIWRPIYRIEREGEVLATIRGLNTWFKPRFDVFLGTGETLEIKGSFWQYEYSISFEGATYASISKKTWSWTDEYGIEIEEGVDDILMLATVVIIDLCNHQGRRG